MRRTPVLAPEYEGNTRKTFRSALCHLLQTEFPGIFGPAVTQLFAERVEELFDQFHPDRSRLKVGQVVWAAVAADDPPARDKRIEQTRLVPVILDLVAPGDIEQMVAGARIAAIRRSRLIRLFHQAYQQGAVLSYSDVSLLMHLRVGTVSRYVLQHHVATKEVIPCRGTIHDLGRSITHKAIICYKRLVEKKTTSEVAAETHHTPESVERYVQTLRRVKLCTDAGMSADETSMAVGHSPSLVEEYLDLIRQYALPPHRDREPSPISEGNLPPHVGTPNDMNLRAR
jgi:hypothetical protein